MASTVRIRLDIAYDGTAFSGWAAQPDQRTVQGTLEDALRIIYRELPEGPLLTVAGRTDAGVHALGQVAHLDLGAETWASTARRRGDTDAASSFVRRMRGVLGEDSDVVVRAASEAPADFDARFSALSRTYEYRLADVATPPNPLERHRTATIHRALELDPMNRAAETLVGLHDFVGYCRPREHATTIRTLEEFRWVHLDDGVFVARLTADAFCHSMVRSLVGMCAEVGSGRMPLDRVAATLELDRRSNAFPVLGARGLTLLGVAYPGGEALAARQETTRARRPRLRIVGDD